MASANKKSTGTSGGAGSGSTSRPGKKRGRGREDDYFKTNKDLIKPSDQEKLSDQQLKEEIIRSLTAIDPCRPKNIVVWDYNEKTFIPSLDTDQMVTLFSLNSELLFKDSEEIRQYKGELLDEFEDCEPDEEALAALEADSKTPSFKKKLSSEKKKEDSDKSHEESPPPQPQRERGSKDETKAEDGEDAEGQEEGGESLGKPGDKPKKLLNQFNYCERATQTLNNPLREKVCQTVPPPRSTYKDYCNQWIIYDSYAKDKEHQPKLLSKADPGDPDEPGQSAEAAQAEEEREKEKKKAVKKEKEGGKLLEKEKVKMRKPSIVEGQAATDVALLKSTFGLMMIERMVTQNIHEEVLDDFMYFEDGSDEFRETGEGTLLPLWKFSYEKAKRMHVTGISWSMSQPDMFAVSYGSFSFVHPVLDGMVVIYSLRNPSYPEQAWLAPKGAMSVDIHPRRNSMIAVGLYDGNVAILNLKKMVLNEPKTIILRNIPTDIKHRAPVWSVRWGADDFDGNPNFYSGGMDGRIIHWMVGVQDLQGLGGLNGTEISTLHLPLPPVTGPDGTSYKLFGCARCLSFHPKEETTFLVGTAEGNIFRCSSLYGSRFPQIYGAHFLPVASIQWNHFHPEVFISCSEDWTIKIWDRRDPEPMYVFEIGLPILDVAWAPYSSTVFAGITDEGKVLVYDLNVNKDKPICIQQVVTKKKVHPHKISFNPHYPIIIVGDDRGHLTTLKLSPNLRILPRDTRNILLEGDQKIQFEINKMTKLLSLVRDPETITNPKGLAGPGGDTLANRN